ncbi:NAD-dependent epimerase/dehydratase family protein [Pseudomonadales bacterium]|nr:NAD-dependent epimerase/dehydratase family protein [Pseudomonadales bacterium]
MKGYLEICEELRLRPKSWLITGVAGFIGSNLLQELLDLDQCVVGIDNFNTGYQQNLNEVQALVGSVRWSNFKFIEGDVTNIRDCEEACADIDYVLHQAALGSVPRSIEDPIATNHSNIDGFLNMLVSARDASVQSFVYAASSSTYGDHPDLPKEEDKIGKCLSPYAVTKLVNELYADVFSQTYGFDTIGLRYFNIFGPRQDPNGAYAAVIPKWADAIIKGEDAIVNGDGLTSRDFCYIANAVQANILAAVMQSSESRNQVYNIAVGESTTLLELYGLIKRSLAESGVTQESRIMHSDFRVGDVRHSLASIEKAKNLLGYTPSHNVEQGLKESMAWYYKNN